LSAGRLTSPEDFGLGDHRRDVCRFQGENFARNQAVVEQLERLARSTRSPA
jgi:aryl-alcohol dehydrogenase-like predicted oxidoreductase